MPHKKKELTVEESAAIKAAVIALQRDGKPHSTKEWMKALNQYPEHSFMSEEFQYLVDKSIFTLVPSETVKQIYPEADLRASFYRMRFSADTDEWYITKHIIREAYAAGHAHRVGYKKRWRNQKQNAKPTETSTTITPTPKVIEASSRDWLKIGQALEYLKSQGLKVVVNVELHLDLLAKQPNILRIHYVRYLSGLFRSLYYG